jgi:Tfp pilus assembly protein PilV
MTGARGFSLIELIMIVVLISIGMVGLMAMFGRSVGSLGTNVDIQSGAQLVQQCAEQVLGRRRQSGTGYALIDATVCNGLPSGSYTYSVTLVAIAGSPAGACPDTYSCKEVRITVNGLTGAVARGSVLVSNY